MDNSLYYSATGALAVMMLILQNYDIMLKRVKDLDTVPWKAYKKLLYSLIIFHMSDFIWGLFLTLEVRNVLLVDSIMYFEAMAFCVLFWTRYAISYLDEQSSFGTLLINISRAFFVVFSGMVIANFFWPVIFWIDEDCGYHTTELRWIMHIVQIVLLIMITSFGITVYSQRKDVSRKRYRTIACSGLIVAIFLFVQLWYPLLPLYTVAFMLGTCMLRAFVVNDEKESYKLELEKSLAREEKQVEALKNARKVAYKDPLTGVKSKSAYVEFENQMNLDIKDGKTDEFALAVFDLNGLKTINDTLGHEKGDEFIVSASRIICEQFKHSPVFRIGGDEFAVVLENTDYQNREELESQFNEIMESQQFEEEVVVAMGMSEYIDGTDYTIHDVFDRADHKMYMRKRQLKGMCYRGKCEECPCRDREHTDCEHYEKCNKYCKKRKMEN